MTSRARTEYRYEKLTWPEINDAVEAALGFLQDTPDDLGLGRIIGGRGAVLERGLARGGKIVVSGLMGGNFSLPMVQWVYKRMTIEGFMVGTLAEAKELMALARAGKIKPTPMKEEPMADVQKWIEELRAGKVVGRIVLKN